jgi:hypothetical protein
MGVLMEPVLGFEPRTDGLQNRCSTTELNWPKSPAKPTKRFPRARASATYAHETACNSVMGGNYHNSPAKVERALDYLNLWPHHPCSAGPVSVLLRCAFQNCHCRGVVLGVAEADKNGARATSGQ